VPDVVIDIRHVNFGYDEELVLEDVNLQLRKGDFLALLGPNGGGKSTLLKLVLGLLTPDTGEIRVFGQPPGVFGESIGYVPQQAANRPGFPITALDVVLMGLRGRRSLGIRVQQSDRERAMAALEQVGVHALAARRIDSLSGGQRQRVFVARALASAPKLLIFDEPTSNIDPLGKFCFYELLAELAKSTSILVVSHDFGITSARITAVACVNRRLIYNSRPELNTSMLELVYGPHNPSCHMDAYIQDIAHFLQPSQRAER